MSERAIFSKRQSEQLAMDIIAFCKNRECGRIFLSHANIFN